MNPNKFLNIEDLQRAAKRKVPSFAFAYLDGGAEDQRTLAQNQQIFSHWQFQPRTLKDTTQRSLQRTLLGHDSKMPLAIAPTGFNGMLWPQADILLARAARDASIPFALSTMSSSAIEDVARAAEGVKLWFQLYVLKDRSITRDLLNRARAVGCDTLIVTTDCAHYGNRERERRHFRAPLKLTARSLIDVALHPGWIKRVMLPEFGLPGFGNLAPYLPPDARRRGRGAQFISGQLDASFNWNDLRTVRDLWPGKLIVKGILDLADAEQSAAIGADAIVLTNHGGRQLDDSISPLQILAETRAACDNRLEILIDSGFRRGTDIAKALALGANGVLIGRPVLYGVAAGGEAGAKLALEILRSELDRSLAQLGVCKLDELNEGFIRLKV